MVNERPKLNDDIRSGDRLHLTNRSNGSEHRIVVKAYNAEGGVLTDGDTIFILDNYHYSNIGPGDIYSKGTVIDVSRVVSNRDSGYHEEVRRYFRVAIGLGRRANPKWIREDGADIFWDEIIAGYADYPERREVTVVLEGVEK